MDRSLIRMAIEATGTESLGAGSFSDVYPLSPGLVVKRYARQDAACPHPFSWERRDELSCYGNAEWEQVIGNYVRSFGERVPRNYGIILMKRDSVIRRYDALAVLQQIPYSAPQGLWQRMRFPAECLFHNLRLERRGVRVVDSSPVNADNVLFDKEGCYFIDLVRWRLAPFAESFESLRERFPPQVFLSDGSRVDKIEAIDDVVRAIDR